MANIYTQLKQDHDNHRALLEKIANTQGDSPERRTLFAQFKAEVTAHANAEEQTLYAVMLEDPDLQNEGRHSVAEHKGLDEILEELANMDMASSGWLNRFNTLRHDYEHHIDEEEKDIFPVADDSTDQATEHTLGDKFVRRKAEALESLN